MIKKWFQSLSVRNQLLTLFCLFILLPVTVLLGYLSSRTAEAMRDEIITANEQTLAQIQINIDNQMSGVMQVSSYFSVNTEFYALITSKADEVWTQINETLRLQRMLENVHTTSAISDVRLYLNSTHMFTHDGRNIFPLKEAAGQPWYENIVQRQEQVFWQSTYHVYSLLSTSVPAVSFVRMLRDPNSFNTVLGYIVFDLQQAVFENILSVNDMSGQTVISLWDHSGSLISPLNQAARLSETDYAGYLHKIAPAEKKGQFQDHGEVILYSKVQNADWYVFLAVKLPPVAASLLASSVGSTLLIAGMILVVFSMLIFALIQLAAYSIQRKTNRILQQLTRIDTEEIAVPQDMNNHFDILENKVNALVASVAELMERNYNDKLRVKDLELRLLQAQINPHFLYNSIDQIYWKAMQHNAPDVAQMLSSLARYFRLSLHRGEDIVTIADEIELIKAYLNLQKSRFGMRFSAEINLQEGTQEYILPKMTLQPLVENALIHGILAVPDRTGVICVSIWKEEDRILCRVRDDGAGMSAAFKDRLLEGPAFNETGSGYGVYSVKERLRLVFGEDCRFEIASEEGKGTTVSFSIPMKKKQ